MLAKFFIAFLFAFTAGPLHNEGGSDAIEAKGVKASVEQAIDEREPLMTGNYGNQ